MKKIEIEKLDRNLISLIHNDWAVLTVPDEGKVNGMTVNWVQMGWLWNKAVVTVYVRPQRHTYPLIERENASRWRSSTTINGKSWPIWARPAAKTWISWRMSAIRQPCSMGRRASIRRVWCWC